MRNFSMLLAAAAMLMATTAWLHAEAAPAAKPDAEAKPAAKDLVIKTLEGIVVDTKAKEVRLAGNVCLREGVLELFACSEGTREHESVFTVKAKASAVTFALALLGLPTGQPGFMTEGGAYSPPAGAGLEISIRYTAEAAGDGAKKTEVRTVPAHQVLRLASSEEPLDRPLEWVYVGQPAEKMQRVSDREGTIICISNFTEAVVDLPFESTDVDAELLYAVNAKALPPLGTPVEIIIRPTGRTIAPKKVEIVVVLKKDQPPTLDGKPMDLEALKSAVNGQPADVRTAVLKADPDERFARVMQIHDLLRDALMQVQLKVLGEKAAPAAKPEAGGPEITVTTDERVLAGGKKITVAEFKAQAADLVKGAPHVTLLIEPKTNSKVVAEVLSLLRDQGVRVTLAHTEDRK